jgi:hypothetical protein
VAGIGCIAVADRALPNKVLLAGVGVVIPLGEQHTFIG